MTPLTNYISPPLLSSNMLQAFKGPLYCAFLTDVKVAIWDCEDDPILIWENPQELVYPGADYASLQCLCSALC